MFRYFLVIFGYLFRRQRSRSGREVSRTTRNHQEPELPRQRRRTLLDLLRIIFRMRPINQVGIMTGDMPMFGKAVDEHVDKRGVSLFVTWCVAAIEKTGEGLRTEALYSASGNAITVKEIAQEKEENMRITLDAQENVHVLTGALKKFITCLKEPLLFTENFVFGNGHENETRGLKIIKYSQALNSCLKHEQNSTLKFFLEHILRVVECRCENKMNVSALSTIIGPILVRSKNVTTSTNIHEQIHITQFLIENYLEIFSGISESSTTMFGTRGTSSYDIAGVNKDAGAQGKFNQIPGGEFSDQPSITPEPRKISESGDQRSMFGGYLQDATDTKTGASQFVVWCVDAVSTTGDNFESDALYRASGNQAKVQEIAATPKKDMIEKLRKEVNVNVLTGALKLYFRRLKKPLLDHEAFRVVSQRPKHASREECLRAKVLIESLQPVEQDTLNYLMKHLRTVLEHSPSNNMSVEGMGVVFGPTLMHLSDDTTNMAGEMRLQNQIIEFFLNNYEHIFTV